MKLCSREEDEEDTAKTVKQKKEYYFVFFFEKTHLPLYGHIIKHVEVSRVCQPAETPDERAAARYIFTTYMGEKFGHFCVKFNRKSSAYRMLLLPVSQLEYDRGTEFLVKMCEAKTHYNYVDLMMIYAPAKRTLWSTFAPDVGNDTMPEKVFCSQAMVLMLRRALCTNRPDHLAEILAGENSRMVSPGMFFQILKNAGCEEGSVTDFYLTGHISHRTQIAPEY